MNYCKIQSSWSEITAAYRKENGEWVILTTQQLEDYINGDFVLFYGGNEETLVIHTLVINGPSTIVGSASTYVAVYDGKVASANTVWSITEGSQYATIAQDGTLTVLNGAENSPVTLSVAYKGLSVSKPLVVTYDAVTEIDTETTTNIETNESGQTITTTTTTTTTTDGEGNTTVTEVTTTVIENEDGSLSSIEQETETKPDGTQTTNSTTVNYDESGNTVGSQTSENTVNPDGSSTGTTTNYNESGDPTTTINTTGDTEGNINIQDVEYDESGNSIVTGYTIDTSGSEDGAKTYNGDGVNTEYYAFDVTRGFLVDIHFTVDASNKPAGQNENHHNILTAKRASPSPWYGFQIRQSNTSKYVQLGTQFSTGGNTNTTIQPMSSTGNTLEYNLRILYNPTVSFKSFVCKNMNNGNNLYTSNNKFPDIEDLKYLKVTVGYAMDENGDPFRYSSIDVKNFLIKRLENLYNPVISCDGQNVSISCDTSEAVIYYRLNQTGEFIQYTSPIAIAENTIVEAYAHYYEWDSNTVIETCTYEEPTTISNPSIYCDGTEVTITCATEGATIYYRLNQSGNYSIYDGAFPITADTIVEAYSKLGEDTSETVTEICIYSEIHDYATDYLTLRVNTGGTICWASVGSESVKPIQYSINGGAWSYLTPPQTGASASINVSDGDVVRFKGSYASYGSSNTNYMGFSGGTAVFDVEGNIMSLVYGDNFVGNTTLTGTYNFCSMFKQTNVVSAENLVLPATIMTAYCYRALFANSPSLAVAPALPATTLAEGCYRYIFQDASIVTAPDLLAETLAVDCYEGMFDDCHNLNYIKCLAKDISASASTLGWVQAVATTGTFVKDANTDWVLGANGIPTRWVVVEEGLKNPTINCDGLEITLACSTQGASIYYRLNQSGEYTLYTAAIPITADTVVEAYSVLDEETSVVVSETCVYDDGIEEPVIYCDGEYVTISCETGGASIYYKFGQEQTYNPYGSALVISADTVCYAYSEANGRQSEVVSANCIYDESLKAPIIECDGTGVTIACHTIGADIYYRLNEEGTFSLYSNVFAISADTVVEAYSEKDEETSSVVSALCEYNNVHDYSLDYLTFDILTSGDIKWAEYGTGQSKTIQYSLNDGPWTSITAGTGATISVSSGDKVRFKGTNTSYAKDKSNYSGFDSGCTASFNIEGNIMSLVYGDNFVGNTALTGTYNFCSIFKQSHCVSAENLVLPSTALTNYCYRAMFSKCTDLAVAPALPATTLAQGCYWYMFEECAITEAPDLLAETLVRECYGYMFTGCRSLSYIKCMAVSGLSAASAKTNWVNNVAASGTFVKDSSVSVSTWGRDTSGIPTNWLVYDDVAVVAPVVSCDGYNNVTITCETPGATIYYKTGQTRAAGYTIYTEPFVISQDVVVDAYSELNEQTSRVVSQTCEYISDIPFESSNRNLNKWNYNNQEVTTPYSVNAIDGHSSSYAKGTFNFETTFALREAQPTYLWFQHADQSASVYIDDTLVEKHWGGYNAFFVDITNAVHSGSNRLKVGLKNNEGNNLAPASGDFNFNGTLGKVKLFTSPYIPAMIYGYDGFHVTSDVAISSATIYVKTSVPTGATVTCEINDGTYHYGTSGSSTGEEMVFSATVQNPHLWNGLADPHLYTITLEILHDGVLYHRYVRPYGLRFYEYAINKTVNGDTYTGFLLNGQPYLLRGCCMHDDIEGKANALDDADYAQTFAIIQELGCNFLRLAHYPHPKETYDWCDRLGIVVQTEVPMVNILKSTQPTDYYTHLEEQNIEMVNQHFNHPCIMFWGLGNEFNAQMDSSSFACTKLEYYRDVIRRYDSERLIGCVLNANSSNPKTTLGGADLDWYGCNIYVGWYSSTNSNNPSSQINTRLNNVKDRAIAYSEYGCGGTQHCHSDDFMTTTTRGNHERHDIEYMMWLHEGQIAAIKNFPQLAFTSQWQLFDIAVANRNEGYTVCLDGVNATTDDSLRRLNNKGLVERDHITKKDPFYLYKAWWNTTDKFVHICGKDYTKMTDRVIKCYTNDPNNGKLSLYVNNTFVEEVTVADNIALFTAYNFSSGDVVRVDGANSSDTFTF